MTYSLDYKHLISEDESDNTYEIPPEAIGSDLITPAHEMRYITHKESRQILPGVGLGRPFLNEAPITSIVELIGTCTQDSADIFDLGSSLFPKIGMTVSFNEPTSVAEDMISSYATETVNAPYNPLLDSYARCWIANSSTTTEKEGGPLKPEALTRKLKVPKASEERPMLVKLDIAYVSSAKPLIQNRKQR